MAVSIPSSSWLEIYKSQPLTQLELFDVAQPPPKEFPPAFQAALLKVAATGAHNYYDTISVTNL